MGKRFLFVLIALLTFTQFANAWEFSMTGEFEWRYRYFGRANGSRDLFGDMNIQNTNVTGTQVGFAGPNYYRGNDGTQSDGTVIALNTTSNGGNVRIVRGGFSGSESDAFVNDQRFTLYPKIVVNKAVDFTAMIDFAGIRQKYNHRDVSTNGPLERWYEDRVSRNAFDTAMLPSINQLKLTAHVPWGTLSLGATKDYPFGTGALFAKNTRASAFVLVIPYGPFRIVPAFWLARSYAQDGFASFNAANSLPTTTTSPDSATKNQFYIGPFITYSQGPLDLGWTIIWQKYHANAANGAGTNYSNPNGAGQQTWRYLGFDHVFLQNTFYLKYNNGKIFGNFEYTTTQDDRYYLGAGVAGREGSFPSYIERSSAFAEVGVLAGPAKLSLLFAWAGGNPLNDGNDTKVSGYAAVNYQAMLPYQYLMFYTYGGGNDAPWHPGFNPGGLGFTNDENGQMGDAYALSARLDYAVAANLNIWGSYLWAHRVEQNGFYAGWKNFNGADAYPTTTYNTSLAKAQAAQAWKAANGFGANANPYVDDGYLGWEIGAGVDWKVLEGLNFRTRYAYWQPGPWFDQAYQAVTINGVMAGANPVGTTGGMVSDKSAIQAFEGSVEVQF